MKQGVRWSHTVVAGLTVLVLHAGCGGAGAFSEHEQPPDCQESRHLEEQELEVPPEADTYAEQARADTVLGAERKLVADNLVRRVAFLRFEVPEPHGPVQRATLRLYALDGSTDGPALYLAPTDWGEAALTWAQAPRPTEPLLGDLGLVPHESWVEYDVTAIVKSGGAYGFALVTESRNGVDFASKEHPHPALAPRLVVRVQAPLESGCIPAR
jgi:hypothetical protein